MAVPFAYHPRMLDYDFGPQHPLRPERLARAVELVQRLTDWTPHDPGPGDVADVLRVHAAPYVDAVQRASTGCSSEEALAFGLGTSDTPAFIGMHDAALAYVAGTVWAAQRVREGAPLAINLSGGLHHARRAMAHGFCVYNDPAVAIHILLERFQKVAYVDIDVHHGDGVQYLWQQDPRVLTLSIHQDPATLYPGTGFAHETGPHGTSVNLPMAPGTTGDVWLDSFRTVCVAAFEWFRPDAIVLQMGTDAHFSDPLAHLRVAVQDWCGAVAQVRAFGLPIVALGGGGYAATAVPRMWAAACLTLAGYEVPEDLPPDLAEAWSMPHFFDSAPPGPSGFGREIADIQVGMLLDHFKSAR